MEQQKNAEKQPTVMVVDDTPANLELLDSILHQADTYHVRALPDPQMALNAMLADPPDLVLLDIKMPGMSGYEVCAALKADARTRDVPIIFISALQEVEDKIHAFSVGGVDYVTKPFQSAEVLARVHTHLQLKYMREKLAQQNQALEEAAQLRDDVDRIMRHDLKGPLNSIIAVPALLLSSMDLTDNQQELLRDVGTAGHKMLDMINRSLDLYKMEMGTYEAQLQNLDLIALLKTAANEAQAAHQAQGKGYRLLYDGKALADTQQVWALAEQMLCYPMFSNLLHNAFEASPADTQVDIDVREDEEHVFISITNHGAVAAEIREHFFDKYVTFGKNKGTGLGTYSAKLCAETQQGAIRLELVDDDKTRIMVSLKKQEKLDMKALIAHINAKQQG
jgi:DNA-binding response OmpR family regulator